MPFGTNWACRAKHPLCNYLKPLPFNRSILHSSSTKTGLVCVLGLKGCSSLNRFFNCLLQNTWKFFPLKQKSAPFVQQMLAIIAFGERSGLHDFRVFCHQVSNNAFEPNLGLTFIFTKTSLMYCSKRLCLAQVTESVLLTHHCQALGNVPGGTFSSDSRGLRCNGRRFQFLSPLTQHGSSDSTTQTESYAMNIMSETAQGRISGIIWRKIHV